MFKSRLVMSNRWEWIFSPLMAAVKKNFHDVTAILKTLLAIGPIYIMFGHVSVLADEHIASYDTISLDDCIVTTDGDFTGIFPHFTRTEKYAADITTHYVPAPPPTADYHWVLSTPDTVSHTDPSKGSRSYVLFLDTDPKSLTFTQFLAPNPLPPFIPGTYTYDLTTIYWVQEPVSTPEPSTYVLALFGGGCLFIRRRFKWRHYKAAKTKEISRECQCGNSAGA